MTFANNCNEIFDQIVRLYHVTDDVDAVFNNPFDADSIEGNLALYQLLIGRLRYIHTA